MSRKPLAPDTLRVVAQRFKVLAEPARLEVLNALREGPLNVSELIRATGLNQANQRNGEHDQAAAENLFHSGTSLARDDVGDQRAARRRLTCALAWRCNWPHMMSQSVNTLASASA